jgi:ankyrin repeat protein
MVEREYNSTALILAALNGNIDVVNIFIIWATKIDLEAVDIDGYTSYVLAIIHGHHKVAKLLADAGADTKEIHKEGFYKSVLVKQEEVVAAIHAKYAKYDKK